MGAEQLGARWFVAYWDSRREVVFGPNKFVMRMTLGEALYDLVGLEAGLYRPLPHSDETGDSSS